MFKYVISIKVEKAEQELAQQRLIYSGGLKRTPKELDDDHIIPAMQSLFYAMYFLDV